MTSKLWIGIAACAVLWGCETTTETRADAFDLVDPITVKTADDITIHATPYFGELSNDAPLILLFHQGGASGRGEYEPLAGWLNENGFRALAWDQRRGGERLGSVNRTLAGLDPNAEYSYCDAKPDLQAALNYAVSNQLADEVIVWGSSYSAALIFELAANNSETVSGVIAFSPASGGPMVDCRARMWIEDVKAPAFVLRPASEMERDPSQEQRKILEEAGVKFRVVENGVHGSSMLVDERTQSDMSEARATVMAWLKQVSN